MFDDLELPPWIGTCLPVGPAGGQGPQKRVAELFGLVKCCNLPSMGMGYPI